MSGLKLPMGFALRLFITGSLLFAEEVTLNPTDDIAIANDMAMGYNAGGLNDGTNDTLTVANYKC
jgi:hypothetical protein